MKSERNFPNEVTISVPRSVLVDEGEESAPAEKRTSVPPLGARHPDEGLGQPFPILFVSRGALVKGQETMLSP